jgi:hypothetical protein
VEGLDLKEFREAMWLLDQTLDPLKRPRPVIQGAMVCPDGHENPGGNFCSQCGKPLSKAKAAGEITAPSPEPEPEIDLTRLHPQSLKKLLRGRGLSDKGTKDEMIRRLREAA